MFAHFLFTHVLIYNYMRECDCTPYKVRHILHKEIPSLFSVNSLEATRHLSGAKKQDHKNPIYSSNLSSTAMALTAEQVLHMLDSSDESEIEEDPEFLLPQDSDF